MQYYSSAGSLVANSATAPASQFFPEHFNDNGQIIGYVGGQPVVYSGGNLTPLPGYPQAINDSGQVVGWAPYQNGQLILDGTQYSAPQYSNAQQHSYIETNGVVRDMGTIPGYESTQVWWALNNAGQAAGTAAHAGPPGTLLTQAFFYDGQHLVPLGTLGGATSYAVGINNKGDVIGVADLPSGSGSNGFVSHAGGPLINLGLLPGTLQSTPTAINDSGQIVGYAGGLQGNTAFLYQSGVLTDLSKLLSPSAGNLTLTNALAINNSGQILVEGSFKNAVDGAQQLFLLTPDGQPIPLSPDPLIQSVPEPSTLTIFGLGIAGMFVRCWRRRPG